MAMTEQINKIKWSQVASGVFLALFSAILGFLVSQNTIVAQVARSDQAISELREADKVMRSDEAFFRSSMRADMLQFRAEFTDRVKLLVDTVNAQTLSTRELIMLVKVQQQVKP